MKRKLSLALEGCVCKIYTRVQKYCRLHTQICNTAYTNSMCVLHCRTCDDVMTLWTRLSVCVCVCVLSSNPVRANKNCYDLKLDQPHCSLEFNKFTVKKKGHVLLKRAEFHCRMDHNPNSFIYIPEFKINLPTQILTSNTSIGIQKISA